MIEFSPNWSELTRWVKIKCILYKFDLSGENLPKKKQNKNIKFGLLVLKERIFFWHIFKNLEKKLNEASFFFLQKIYRLFLFSNAQKLITFREALIFLLQIIRSVFLFNTINYKKIEFYTYLSVTVYSKKKLRADTFTVLPC